MKCKDCKKELMPEFRFCPYCGREVRKVKSAVKLPKASQLPSGAWRCQIQVDGKRVSVVKDSKREAMAEAVAIRDGIIAIKEKPSTKKLTAAIDDFIIDRNNVLSQSTIKGYRIIQHRWDKLVPDVRLCDLTEEYLQKHYNSITKNASVTENTENKYARKTLDNDLAFICEILTANGLPKPSIKLQTKRKAKRLKLTKAEIKTLCEAVKGTESEIPVLLGLSSITLSEMCGLYWDAVDLEHKTITINKARLYDEHNKIIEKDTNKNETRQRTVPILMDQLYNALSAVENKTGRVITVYPHTIGRRLKRICKANNLPDITPHDLRHAFASLSLSAEIGLSADVTQAIGGWKTDKVMKEVYQDIFADEIAAGADALSQFFNEIKQKKS